MSPSDNEAQVIDIYPSFWKTSTDKVTEMSKTSTDSTIYRIKNFGVIYARNDDNSDKKYFFDLYLTITATAEARGIGTYFTMTDFRRMDGNIYIELKYPLEENILDDDILFPGLKQTLSDAIITNKELINNELIPLRYRFAVRAQTEADFRYGGFGNTSFSLYLSYIYVHDFLF